MLSALNKYIPQDEILYTSGYYATKFLKNGSQIEVNTALQPENLRGPQIDLAIFDEFAMMKGSLVWNEIIRPMLATRKGKAVFISTPKGKATEFFKLFQMGQSTDYPEYRSWKYKSKDSPYFPESEYELAKKETPYTIFLQEYDAEFIDSVNAVFHNIWDNVTFDVSTLYDDIGELIIEKPNPGGWYTVGCDPADRSSYCVITVVDNYTGNMVYFNRFQRMGYSYISETLKRVSKEYRSAKVIVDSTGIGNCITEDLDQLGVYYKPYLFTNQSKNDLLSHLSVLIEKGFVHYPSINQLLLEMESMQFEFTQANHMVYVSQQHTDTIMAFALACHEYNPVNDSELRIPIIGKG